MKKSSALSNEFYTAFSTYRKHTQVEWLTYLGQPCMYDGGLYVNRSSEDHQVSNKQWIALESHLRNVKRSRE